VKDGNGRSGARGRAALRVVAVAALMSATVLVAAPPAYATISSPSATTVAADLTASGTSTTGASWSHAPAGTPDGVSDAPMAGFPTEGSSFAILTTGDVNSADDAPPSTAGGTTTDWGDGPVRGDMDFDVSILKIDFTVGDLENCLRFDFRFLSEEYPEYLKSSASAGPAGKFNDAFIAELDTSDWTTSGTDITAPHNFAFDPSHNPISINAVGNTSMTVGPDDTTYDGATPILTAAQTVGPGAHSLYLSIFDNGDGLADSAVFLDNFVVGHVADAQMQCAPGAAPKYDLTLTPPSAVKNVGTTHTVTATVTELATGPVNNGKVLFTLTGTHSGSGSAMTNSSGVATYDDHGTAVGSDTILACFDADASDSCDPGEARDTAVVRWIAAPALPTTGAPIALIVAAGVLAMLLGVGGYLLIRRRRVRFVAE
jgi:LPXTG-motif cell wall-anchored protein